MERSYIVATTTQTRWRSSLVRINKCHFYFSSWDRPSKLRGVTRIKLLSSRTMLRVTLPPQRFTSYTFWCEWFQKQNRASTWFFTVGCFRSQRCLLQVCTDLRILDSGHGGQRPDKTGSESDGKIECECFLRSAKALSHVFKGIYPVDYKFRYYDTKLTTNNRRFGDITLGKDGVITDKVRFMLNYFKRPLIASYTVGTSLHTL